MVKIGPSFGEELVLAGLGGLPFSWNTDSLNDLSRLTRTQQEAVRALLAVHDPASRPTNDRKTAKADLAGATTIAQLRNALVKLLA